MSSTNNSNRFADEPELDLTAELTAAEKTPAQLIAEIPGASNDPGAAKAREDAVQRLLTRILSLPPLEADDCSKKARSKLGTPSADGTKVKLLPDLVWKAMLKDAATKTVKASTGKAKSNASPHMPLAGAPDLLRYTDLGNARQLVEISGANLRYCGTSETWYVYDSADGTGRWVKDSKQLGVQRLAKAISKNLVSEAEGIAKQAKEAIANGADGAETLARQSNAVLEWAQRSAGWHTISNAINLAQSEPSIKVEPKDLDKDRHLLSVANGVLDLRTGELLPSDRNYLITRGSPVAYDREAVCPIWDKFLGEVFENDAELIPYVQRMLGYALTGEITANKIFLLWGPAGRNGKGVLCRTASRILGGVDGWAMTAKPTLLVQQKNEQHSTSVAVLEDARLVTIGELPTSCQLDEGKVKDFTGGDILAAHRMHQDEGNFSPKFKIWQSMNNLPEIRGQDAAMWARIHLIPFMVSFEGREDVHLEEKLQGEFPGILSWAVKGAIEWYRAGLQPPAKVLAAVAKYKSDEDALGGFIAEDCSLGNMLKDTYKNVWTAYKIWGDGDRPIPQRRFRKLLEGRKGISLRDGHGGKLTVYGLGLNADAAIKVENSRAHVRGGVLLPDPQKDAQDLVDLMNRGSDIDNIDDLD